MKQFKKGDIVRYGGLFVMVVFDPNPSVDQFNGVCLRDIYGDQHSGEISNSWNTDKFTLSSWRELFNSINPA